MATLKNLWLDRNAITDIGPLADRSVFGGPVSAGAFVNLNLNPLDDTALEQHIPALRTWGVVVRFVQRGTGVRATPIADPTLRALVADASAYADVHVDDDPATWPIVQLQTLRLNGRGIGSLVGLEAARGLESLHAASNRIGDLSPLGGLENLAGLDLRHNRISDISPLVSNNGLSSGDWVALDGNPLSETSLNVHVPALLQRGVEVSVGTVAIGLAVDGDAVRFDTTGYFEAVLGAGYDLALSVDDEARAMAAVTDGVLVVTPGARAGSMNATLSATGAGGESATLTFAVTVRGAWVVPFFPSASDPSRQGFVRVINQGAQAGEVRIVPVDDSGMRKSPLTLAIDAGAAVHFNSDDLEDGNPAKGLTGSSGGGTGAWRLQLESALDLQVLAYLRTPDGFLAAMQKLAPETEAGYRVPIFNPGSNINQVSILRLANLGSKAAEAVVRGIDDHGETPGSEVRLDVAGGATVSYTAAELESGGPGLSGTLGDGSGKWRLQIAAEGELAVMSLLRSPEGYVTNLSAGASGGLFDDNVHTVPLFPSAADPLGRQGFVRVINGSRHAGTVRIHAYDDAGRRYEPLTLDLGVGQAAHFNSDDLELGNPEKGVSGSTGPGLGDWRLELSSALEIEVLAYIRTPGGFLTAMHDLVSRNGRRFDVATFNPGSNARQASRLRLVNAGSRPAHFSIAGVDDAGAHSEDVVLVTIPAGATLTPSAAQLEAGGASLQGTIGYGRGKWRLLVDVEQPVMVMNLLSSPTGHLTNLSGGPGG